MIMLFIQYFICIIAPVTLFQDSYCLLGTAAVINLMVYTWSSIRYTKASGAPPAS